MVATKNPPPLGVGSVKHNAIINTCKKYDIPVCDIYSNSGFDTSKPEHKEYTCDDDGDGAKDGVHPTTQGYERFYVPLIVAFLTSI